MSEGITAWRAYLYAVSFVALIVAIAGAVNLLAVGIEVFAYPPPQPYPVPHLPVRPFGSPPVPEYYPGLPASVAQVVVGLIVWGYHWRLLWREH